ncbi:DUF2946 family protein [Pseudophaeobacter leonis]|uniref:DUF2946 family protein n=1 Tax=Pseudophaeobacter leonis TaxID=1144477 RepID=UPI0009F3E75A|nr:DUF2946 family protein [Pseudophaeobacter leonis]
MLFPAVAWLFIQFSMSGLILGTSANAMQVEICSRFGIQTISINPDTGEPTEQAIGSGCDWCQSFGATIDIATRHDVAWSAFERDHTQILPASPRMHVPLRLVAGFQSRAPPIL